MSGVTQDGVRGKKITFDSDEEGAMSSEPIVSEHPQAKNSRVRHH